MKDSLPADVVWKKYWETRDSGARDEIILRYIPLVKYVLSRLNVPLQSDFDAEDVLGYGTMGLIEAIQRFDPSYGVKFESYAIPRIRGNILDMVRKLEPRARGWLRTIREIEDAREQLIKEFDREPTDDELAVHAGISARKCKTTLLEGEWHTVSIFDSCSLRDDVENLTLADVIKDEQCLNPEMVVEKRELLAAVRQAIRFLPKRLQLVLFLRYYKELTSKDIASALGISESRASQIHIAALLRLRSILRGNRTIQEETLQCQKRRLEVA